MTDSSDRQEAELDALRAMYPEEGAVMLDALADDTHQDPIRAPGLEAVASCSGTVKIPGVLLYKRPVGMHFQLPRSYPEEPPQVHVICEAGMASGDLSF